MSAPVELYSPEFFADPYAYYGRLREEDPVHWHPEHRTWILTRHADVNRVARQPELYSSRLAALDTLPPSPPVRPQDAALVAETDAVHLEEFIQMDPPLHTGKRAAVSPRFAPKVLERWRPVVRGIISDLLDAVAGDGTMDVRAAVALPLPLLAISRLMGVPPADVAAVAEQAQRRMAGVLSLDDDRLAVAASGFRDTAAYLDGALGERHAGRCPVAAPADGVVGGDLGDVLADMVDAERAGRWTRAETLANAMMLIDAGHETTVQLICNATLALLTRPEQWRLLCADPAGRAAGAVDEVLRFDPPLHALRRIVTADVELQGHRLRAGDRVLAVVAAANRDPRRFPDPERFDIERRPNSHLAFGAGAHYCLGQYLARLEGQEYLIALAERFPGATVPDPAAVTYAPVPRVRSVTALPISWSH